MKKNILLIFGGKSCEHDISIISAIQTIKNINEYLYKILPVYINKNGEFYYIKNLKQINASEGEIKVNKKVALIPGSNYLYFKNVFGVYKKSKRIDSALIIMHGKNGEDGTISALLNLCNIPYPSSDICASAICLDKCIFKSVLKDANLPVLDGVVVTEQNFFNNTQKVVENVEKQIGFPCIIKPANLGSSIGIKVCNKKHDLANFIENALKFDKKVLIEEYLNNIKEINVAVFNYNDELIVSDLEQPISSDDILSFSNKYLSQGQKGGDFLQQKQKPKLSKKLTSEIIDSAKKCYEVCGFKGVVRFDFILDENNNVFINEANSIPGSLANYLFKGAGIGFDKLLDMLIMQGIIDFEKEKRLINSFESSVLKGIDFNKFKK